MEYGKYIIKEIKGCEIAIIFDFIINHCDIGTKGDSRGKTISAGFFCVQSAPNENDKNDISVSVWGKSDTLKLESRIEDEGLIKRVLRKG